ncbi:nitrate reductase narX [Mycobacterium tuberculosis RGTB327]|nr:nitrate reductase narX [Mycobacterium tuberculosis RGTB327]
MTVTPRTGSRIEELLARSGRFFIPGEISADLRTVTRRGGRDGDVFYRDRWSHDKVVRSTHGVNCTGSCSWKIYVKDDIITWETQETDYPSVGPDRPEYEPRGCPRGAAFSWYTYSPTRVRHPYARGVLVEMYREAKARLGDPVAAWADIQADPRRRRRYQRARGKGGLVRVSWAEATEMIAAAHVHTISTYGPDRVAGFSPIPAMSMVSHAAGSRFVELIGGVMTSFYDWYADLPVASPQVFGDQTDVPESGDWWDVVWQCASVLLTYPNSRQLGTAEELLAHIDGPAADLLGRTVSELRRADPLTAATRYVDTFDLRGRATLYLTYWTAGDTRNRGREMLAFAQTYRSTDVAPPRGETPDFLPVVLEFAATVDPEAGRRLLSGYRVPIAALCNALTEAALPYAHTVAAVCRTGDMMGELFWTVVPYVTMTIVAVGSWWRYRYDKFGWTTRSSQLYESRLLRIASPMFQFRHPGGHRRPRYRARDPAVVDSGRRFERGRISRAGRRAGVDRRHHHLGRRYPADLPAAHPRAGVHGYHRQRQGDVPRAGGGDRRGTGCDGVGLRRCRRGVQLPRDGVGVVPLGVGTATARGPDGRGSAVLPDPCADRVGVVRVVAVHPAGTRVQRPDRLSVPPVHHLPQPRGAGANAAAAARVVTGVRLRRADRTAHRDRR